MIIMKRILHRIIDYRVLSVFFTGTMLLFLMSGCDEVVEEPVPSIELYNGYSVQLTSLSSNVRWESNNPSVATVSSTGLVTAIKAGKAVIYTYSTNEQQEVACYLEVHPKRNNLFYIGAGQSGIDSDAPAKINQIRDGWQPGRGEMIIYIDRVQQGACLLRVNETKNTQDRYGLDTIQIYGAENSADAEVLSRVINKVVQDYPADSYGMIFFSHGSGWLPEGTLSRPYSLVIDDNNGGGKTNREMEYYDFAAAIPDKQFDFIILEACLMADVMSMYELRNKTEYVLASSAEIVAPGFGGASSDGRITTEIYKKEIMRLYDTKNDTKETVLGFINSYYDHIAARPENDVYCSTTLSLIKMDEMVNLATITKAVLNGKSLDETTLLVDSIQHFDRPNSDQVVGGFSRNNKYFDLAHTIEKLVSTSEYNIFNSQMEKTVVWKASTKRFFAGGSDSFYINHHSGLTTYIEQDAFPYLNSVYKNSSWYKAVY